MNLRVFQLSHVDGVGFLRPRGHARDLTGDVTGGVAHGDGVLVDFQVPLVSAA